MAVKIISSYKDRKILYNHTINKKPDKDEFDLHTHDICELIFLKKGDVSGIISGKVYKLHKNDLIIFRPGVLHGISIDSDIEYERINILFDEKLIANRAFEKIPKETDVINYEGNEYITEIFKKLDFYYNHFSGDDLKKLVTSLVEEIIFNLTIVKDEKLRNEPVFVDSMVDMAIEYIDKHYSGQISIDDICNELYISKSHLHHIFMEKLHISPKKYINLQRLAKARNMIRNGKKPYSVFIECGFKDYATFYRNYKLHFGHVPSQEAETEIERKIKS